MRCGRRSGTTSVRGSTGCCRRNRPPGTSALLLFLERSGYPEETYHTFSYSPLRDDDGHVVGMLCVVSEDTQRVIGERRMATLRDLGSDPPSVIRTEEESLAFAAPPARAESARPPVHADLPLRRRWRRAAGGYQWDRGGAPGGPRSAAGRRRCGLARWRGPRGAIGCWSNSTAIRTRNCRPVIGPNRPAKALVRPADGTGRHVQRIPGGSAEPLPPAQREIPRLRDIWSPHTSRQESAAPGATSPSSGGPRSWPSWIAPRRRSSPISVTSSAPR